MPVNLLLAIKCCRNCIHCCQVSYVGDKICNLNISKDDLDAGHYKPEDIVHDDFICDSYTCNKKIQTLLLNKTPKIQQNILIKTDLFL